MIITNVFSFKLVEIFGFTFGAGALLFPVCLILGDIITEVYGFRRARSVIITSLLCFFFYAAVSQLIVALPAAAPWQKHQESFAIIFSFAPRVFIAGSLAYLVGELSNSLVMSKMKTWSNGKHFFSRAVVSTIIGELLNSVVFFTIVFWGKFDSSIIFAAIVNGTILKTIIEVVVYPLTSFLVTRLKRYEGVEFFDEIKDNAMLSREQ